MTVREVFDEVQDAGMQLFQDLKYPVDKANNIVFLNYMHPDILPVIVHQLISLGYRVDETKRVIKPRKVTGAGGGAAPGLPEDFVTYVPVDGPDEPLVVSPPKPSQEGWSVRPTVNMIEEKR